ncbi:MAG TPA: AAA family ATPase, partial [Polyangiales bacterium]
MDDAPHDSLDALCLAAAPQRERRRDLEAELARQRVLARVAGSRADVRVLLGRFEVVRCIGRGGMGKVFEARDRQEGFAVALKVLSDPSDQALARLKREFRLLRDLSHPHLVAMYELHVEQELPFFTMELIDGPALDQVLARGALLDPSFVTRAVLQLGDALATLHARGTVHGDVKPSNILVQRGGPLVLVDFGVARSLGDTHSTGIAGTPAYMAPERLCGAPADAPGDWYALGAVLAELLARVPSAAPEDERLRALRELRLGLQAHQPARRSGPRELLAALGVTGTRAHDPWFDQGTSFVGRQRELEQLRRALARCEPQSVVCAVSGEAGIGKTALVERFLASVQPDVLALRGRCYEDESLPYKGFEGVLDDLAAHLSRLPAERRHALVPHEVDALIQVFPSLQRVWPNLPHQLSARERSLRARRFAFDALGELLSHLACERRLVLFLDDLQWGDADGAALLSYLLSGPRAPVQLVIGTFRSDADGPCVRALLDLTTEPPLALGPLAPDACDDLARELSGDVLRPQLRQAVMRESAGSPLL